MRIEELNTPAHAATQSKSVKRRQVQIQLWCQLHQNTNQHRNLGRMLSSVVHW
jgi:hypothetical protein